VHRKSRDGVGVELGGSEGVVDRNRLAILEMETAVAFKLILIPRLLIGTSWGQFFLRNLSSRKCTYFRLTFLCRINHLWKSLLQSRSTQRSNRF